MLIECATNVGLTVPDLTIVLQKLESQIFM